MYACNGNEILTIVFVLVLCEAYIANEAKHNQRSTKRVIFCVLALYGTTVSVAQ